MICSKCESQCSAGQKFCHKCGNCLEHDFCIECGSKPKKEEKSKVHPIDKIVIKSMMYFFVFLVLFGAVRSNITFDDLRGGGGSVVSFLTGIGDHLTGKYPYIKMVKKNVYTTGENEEQTRTIDIYLKVTNPKNNSGSVLHSLVFDWLAKRITDDNDMTIWIVNVDVTNDKKYKYLKIIKDNFTDREIPKNYQKTQIENFYVLEQ